MRRSVSCLACAALFVGLFFPAGAADAAQADILAPLSVRDRQSYYHNAEQITHGAGSFQFAPSVDATYHSTDNLRASPANAVSDHVLTLAPSLAFLTGNPDRGVKGLFQLRALQFARHTSQNQLNGTLRLAPYYRLSHGWSGVTTVAVIAEHELQAAESSQPLADEPTPYRQISLGSQLLRDAGRLASEFFVTHDRFTFGNTDLTNGGRAVNDDRDRADSGAGFAVALQTPGKRNSIGGGTNYATRALPAPISIRPAACITGSTATMTAGAASSPCNGSPHRCCR